jgi:hypothetical protein
MWEDREDYKPTNKLRFVDGELQQLWLCTVRVRGKWCFSRVVSYKKHEWRPVRSLDAVAAKQQDLYSMVWGAVP